MIYIDLTCDVAYNLLFIVLKFPFQTPVVYLIAKLNAFVVIKVGLWTC